jgi:hypothetical protein
MMPTKQTYKVLIETVISAIAKMKMMTIVQLWAKEEKKSKLAIPAKYHISQPRNDLAPSSRS